jgi:hypothetical protein
MNVAHHPLRRTALCVFLASGLSIAASAQAQNISGAIFTTTDDGATVNGNNYAQKTDVYLNGGPQNCISPGLPNGNYYYMVTNPSGSMLLSLDSVLDRRFSVTSASSGKIAANLGNSTTHVNGTSPCANAISVRLAKDAIDYADTPNPGGVYKAWITREADFNAACPSHAKSCELAGFINSNTKTDNFRVRTTEPPPNPVGNLEAFKYYDHNVNGVYDAGDTALRNWPMTIGPDVVDPQTQLTSVTGLAAWTDLPTDVGGHVYTVTEGEPVQTNWFNSEPSGGDALDNDTVTTPITQSTTVFPDQTAHVDFGNFCMVASGGLTLGYWSNKNGQYTMNDGGTMAPELLLLRNLHLRTAAGGDFDPYDYTTFRTWLLSATATNMAYMLSAQLAAMKLNVEAHKVNGTSFVMLPPYYSGHTINDLITAANNSLAANGYTVAASTTRTYQEKLKTALDLLNNGAKVVPKCPCTYSFTVPTY